MYKVEITRQKEQPLSARGSIEEIKKFIPNFLPNFNIGCIDKIINTGKPLIVNLKSKTISITKMELDSSRAKIELDLVKRFVSNLKGKESATFENISKNLASVLNSI